MNTHVVINENNVVINRVVWDGETSWTPPEFCIVKQNDSADIGDIWNEELNIFTKP